MTTLTESDIRAEFVGPEDDRPLSEILQERRLSAEEDAQFCERRGLELNGGSARDRSFARRARRAADIAAQTGDAQPLVIDRAAGICATSADRIFGW